MSMITITANGDSYEIKEGTTLADFVQARGLVLTNVVIEYNGQALPRTQAAAVTLSGGDQLEIVRIVAGG